MRWDDTKILCRFVKGLSRKCLIDRNQSYQSFSRGKNAFSIEWEWEIGYKPIHSLEKLGTREEICLIFPANQLIWLCLWQSKFLWLSSGSEKQAKNLVIDSIKRFHVGFTRSKNYVSTDKSKKALVSTLFCLIYCQ